MLASIRRHVAANLVGYLALVIATSGTAYAASITGADIVNNTVTGADVKESTLAQVPKSLLAGKRIKYKVTRPVGDYDFVKVLDFRGLELWANCANLLAIATVSVRSTISGASFEYSETIAPLGTQSVAQFVALGGQTLQQGGTLMPFAAVHDDDRGWYEMVFRFTGGNVTVVLMVSAESTAGGTRCVVEGIATGS